jgi:hypothetical protein
VRLYCALVAYPGAERNQNARGKFGLNGGAGAGRALFLSSFHEHQARCGRWRIGFGAGSVSRTVWGRSKS